MKTRLSLSKAKEAGVALVEYALLIALLGVVSIVSLQELSGHMDDSFRYVGKKVCEAALGDPGGNGSSECVTDD